MIHECAAHCAPQEFEEMIAPILSAAYGMAFHMTRNCEEAEDLVQDAAVRAFRAITSFQPGTNFKAWFFKIMINLFRIQYRRRQRQPQMAAFDDAPDLYLYAQTASLGLCSENTNPAALVISKMSEEHIQAAMQALPEEYRLAAVLYFMDESSYQEIADILDCPVGTVRSRLHRGRKLLQKALWQMAREHNIVTALCAEKDKCAE